MLSPCRQCLLGRLGWHVAWWHFSYRISAVLDSRMFPVGEANFALNLGHFVEDTVAHLSAVPLSLYLV